MSGSRTAGQQGRVIGTPGLRARLDAREANAPAELEAKLAEMRKLAAEGVITQEALADWEARGGRELIELRESGRTGATMGTQPPEPMLSEADLAVDLYEAFRRQGHSERVAFDMARGRDVSERAMREALAARNIPLAESAPKPRPTAAPSDLEKSFRKLGLSESAARTAARGR